VCSCVARKKRKEKKRKEKKRKEKKRKEKKRKEKKRKEKKRREHFTLFSDHDRSLLRQQPGALCSYLLPVCCLCYRLTMHDMSWPPVFS